MGAEIKWNNTDRCDSRIRIMCKLLPKKSSLDIFPKELMASILVLIAVLLLGGCATPYTTVKNEYALQKVGSVGVLPVVVHDVLKDGGGIDYFSYGSGAGQGVWVATPGESEPSKYFLDGENSSARFTKELTAHLKRLGYWAESISDNTSAIPDATIHMTVHEFGYAAIGMVYPFHPFVIASVSITDRLGNKLYDEYVSLGTSAYSRESEYAGFNVIPRSLGKLDDYSFLTRNDPIANQDRVNEGLRQALQITINGLNIPSANVARINKTEMTVVNDSATSRSDNSSGIQNKNIQVNKSLNQSDSVPEKIRELQRLRQEGILTEVEYQNKKKQLLDRY
jgi:hypothetical protein